MDVPPGGLSARSTSMFETGDSPLAALRADPLFSGAAPAAVARLLGAAEPAHWPDGAILYERGASADMLLLVTSGRVRLDSAAGRSVAIEAPGRCGEEAAGFGIRVCDAVAEGPVSGFRLPRAALLEFAKFRPSFAVDATSALVAHLGGEPIALPARAAPRREGPLSPRQAVGWAAVLVLPPLVYMLARWGGASVEGALFSAILSAVVLLWVLQLVDEFVPPLAAVVATLFVGLAPARVVLAGFSSPGLLTLLGVFALSSVIGTSGLARRSMLRLLAVLPDRPAWQRSALLAGGALLSPVTPSSNARLSLLLPLQREMAEGSRIPPGSTGRTALLVAAFGGAVLFSPLLATSKSANLAAIELLPTQVRDEFRGAWWLVGSAVAAVGLVACHVLSMRRLFPDESQAPPSRERIAEQLRLLGPTTTAERFAIVGFLFFFVGTLTQSWHHVPSPWLAGVVLLGLLLTGLFGKREFRDSLDWPMVFFLLGMDGITRTMNHLGLDAAFADAVAGSYGFVGGRIVPFVAAALVTTLVIRLALPITAGMLTSAVVLLPVASAQGIHPWICIFLTALFSDIWFFRHQSSAWTQAVAGGWVDSSDEPRFLAHNRRMNLARVAVAFLSIPWWRWLGLL